MVLYRTAAGNQSRPSHQVPQSLRRKRLPRRSLASNLLGAAAKLPSQQLLPALQSKLGLGAALQRAWLQVLLPAVGTAAKLRKTLIAAAHLSLWPPPPVPGMLPHSGQSLELTCFRQFAAALLQAPHIIDVPPSAGSQAVLMCPARVVPLCRCRIRSSWHLAAHRNHMQRRPAPCSFPRGRPMWARLAPIT